jgi:hypothetical protein
MPLKLEARSNVRLPSAAVSEAAAHVEPICGWAARRSGV